MGPGIAALQLSLSVARVLRSSGGRAGRGSRSRLVALISSGGSRSSGWLLKGYWTTRRGATSYIGNSLSSGTALGGPEWHCVSGMEYGPGRDGWREVKEDVGRCCRAARVLQTWTGFLDNATRGKEIKFSAESLREQVLSRGAWSLYHVDRSISHAPVSVEQNIRKFVW